MLLLSHHRHLVRQDHSSWPANRYGPIVSVCTTDEQLGPATSRKINVAPNEDEIERPKRRFINLCNSLSLSFLSVLFSLAISLTQPRSAAPSLCLSFPLSLTSMGLSDPLRCPVTLPTLSHQEWLQVEIKL